MKENFTANGKYFEWLFKYLWLVLILPKPAQLVVLGVYALFLFYKNGCKANFDKFSVLVCAYIVVHIISVIVHIPSVEDKSRIFAAGNTVAIWCVAVLLYSLYSMVKIDVEKIEKYCFIDCMIFLGVFALFRVLVWFGIYNFSMPVLGHCLVAMENQENAYIRFCGFLDYPTLVAILCLMLIPYAWIFIYKKLLKLNKIYAIAVEIAFYAIMFLPVFYCYSRVGYLLYLLGFIGIAIVLIKDNMPKHEFNIFVICVIVLILIATILCRDYLVELVDKLWNMRQGSNISRQMIYEESIQEWLKSPIVGKGIKVIGKANYPLGSHSTYIGFLYKTGILGTVFIAVALFSKIKEIIKTLFQENLPRQIIAEFMILFYVYLIFEDVDGANWLICLIFSNLGLFENRQKLN